ncbi:MAG TPA: hypothetical protein VN736_06515 [Candidatus Limnocylindrales bacterium]|nr:hypothetical protein [Candidatus Limnocylindrales bacterium]
MAAEQFLGRTAAFLLPSLKLRDRASHGMPLEEHVHRFLMDEFGGYTAAAGNIFGFWKDSQGAESYGEHRQFTVALTQDSKLAALKSFLSRLAAELGEECIYLEVSGSAMLIHR